MSIGSSLAGSELVERRDARNRRQAPADTSEDRAELLHRLGLPSDEPLITRYADGSELHDRLQGFQAEFLLLPGTILRLRIWHPRDGRQAVPYIEFVWRGGPRHTTSIVEPQRGTAEEIGHLRSLVDIAWKVVRRGRKRLEDDNWDDWRQIVNDALEYKRKNRCTLEQVAATFTVPVSTLRRWRKLIREEETRANG